jgi:hypothetical protein
LWIVLVAAFAFSAFVVLSAYAPDMRGGSDAGGHALSRSAVGYAGLVTLLREENEAVDISRRDAGDRDPAWSLLVLTPGPEFSPDDVAQFTQTGPTLLVLPKWNILPDPQNTAWVKQAGVINAVMLDKALAKAKLGVQVARRGDRVDLRIGQPGAPGQAQPGGIIDQLQTVQTDKTLIPLLVDGRGQALLVTTPDRKLAILSDPDLLNTHGLHDPRTALVASRLIDFLRIGDGPVAFDVSLNGFGSPPSLLKLAFEPPFLGATLSLVAAAALMGLHAASRFAPPKRVGRALNFGKRALADNSAGLIRLAKREPRMAPRYLDLTRAAVAKALGLTRQGEPELARSLDRVGEAGGVARRFSDLAAEATAVKTRADLLRVARDLYHWRLEMTRERR